MHTAIVTEILPLVPGVVQVTVSFTGAFDFSPGQWVTFQFPEGPSRAYTIASAPQRPEAVQLAVRLGSGPGGEALRKLEKGTTIRIEGPFGEFVVPENDSRNLVLIAGDVGVAPIRSIVLHLLASGDSRKATVLYEPNKRHILYAGDFDPLARAGRITHESGAIEMLLDRHRGALTGSVVMAAGFDGFLDRVRKTLAANGVDPAKVLWESFGPEPAGSEG